MITRRLILASMTALALAMPAAAQDRTRSKTFEGPNVSVGQTNTVNRETGTATRDKTVTNLATGNTATSSSVRQRTETGSTIASVQTGPRGNSRSLNGERVRTENGSTFNGAATGRGGETYGLAGSRSRDGQGNSSASQSVTGSTGETLFNRNRTTARSNGQVSRNVNTTKAQGFKPPRVRSKRPR